MNAGQAVGAVFAVLAASPLGANRPTADPAGEHVAVGLGTVVRFLAFWQNTKDLLLESFDRSSRKGVA